MNNNFINNLEWKENSFSMYKAILNAVPRIFAKTVNNKIESWIIKNNIKVVTEDLIFKAVEDIAPSDLANNKIKPELMKLRTSN